MNPSINPTPPLVRWAAAAFTPAGQTESGDQHLVTVHEGGVFVAVVDGAGHGEQAAVVARRAIDVCKQYSADGLITLVQRCHQILERTRGAVMTLASFDARKAEMTWIGVGNVEGLLIRASAGESPRRETLLLRRGVVGYKLPPLAQQVLPIFPGDTLILTTDGIRPEFLGTVNLSEPPQRLADRICASYAKGSDDALVLVAQYRGYT